MADIYSSPVIIKSEDGTWQPFILPRGDIPVDVKNQIARLEADVSEQQEIINGLMSYAES